MKYQNWKSYLNKSLNILFLALAIILVKVIPSSIITDELDLNYLLDGMIVAYGVVLVLIYLIINKKYLYLVKYGLIYIIYGATLMFISPTIEGILDDASIHFVVMHSFTDKFSETYFEIIIMIVMLLHGIFKLAFSDTYSTLVRVIEVFVGIVFILTTLLFVYANIHALRSGFDISFLDGFVKILPYIFFVLVIIDTALFVFRFVKNGKYIKEEIEEQIIESKASFRKDNIFDDDNHKKIKRRIRSNVEVIDLERFFKAQEKGKGEQYE